MWPQLRFDWEKKQVAFYVDQVLQQRNIPFRRETSNYIGACALGNRDKCTTWFDSIRFVRETRLFRTEVTHPPCVCTQASMCGVLVHVQAHAHPHAHASHACANVVHVWRARASAYTHMYMRMHMHMHMHMYMHMYMRACPPLYISVV